MKTIRISKYTDDDLEDIVYKIACINRKLDALHDRQDELFGNLVSLAMRLEETISKKRKGKK